ncbi:hypothetical protein MKW94_022167, partial [Papaver nudicaule]|nr:hypothetical protein [Papaver nudicaule]
ICGWLYKKHLFLTNLPFAKGDLVQLKVDGNLICGLVEEVGGTKISIRGADDGFLNYVPNSEVDAKFVKILNLVTVVKAPSVQVVSADAKNAGVDTEKDPKKKAHDSSNVLKGKNTSEDQVGAELRLWGITINMELTFESYNLMNEKITKIREFLTSDSLVREHELIMVSFESYLPDKKAFKILVGFFVEAQKNIKEYSDIKAYFLMKLVETVNTQ